MNTNQIKRSDFRFNGFNYEVCSDLETSIKEARKRYLEEMSEHSGTVHERSINPDLWIAVFKTEHGYFFEADFAENGLCEWGMRWIKADDITKEDWSPCKFDQFDVLSIAEEQEFIKEIELDESEIYI